MANFMSLDKSPDKLNTSSSRYGTLLKKKSKVRKQKTKKKVEGKQPQLKTGGKKVVKNVQKKRPQLKRRKKTPKTGVVYIGNIPHGFYEEQLEKYFTQFGKISRLRVARSKKTGKSKGYAFIEFELPEVAKVTAETMDKYLMDKRLLKAEYLPPTSDRKDFFKGRDFTETHYPSKINRAKEVKNINSIKDEEECMASLKRLYKNAKRSVQKLNLLNIEYDFKPVDVPNDLYATKSNAKKKPTASNAKNKSRYLKNYWNRSGGKLASSRGGNSVKKQNKNLKNSSNKNKNSVSNGKLVKKTTAFKPKQKQSVGTSQRYIKSNGVAQKKKTDLVKAQIKNKKLENYKMMKTKNLKISSGKGKK